MNLQNQVVKSMCGFYADRSHLVAMLFPYISNKVKNDANITTILEEGIEENINELMNNMSINKRIKKEILNINWNSTKIYKYSELEEKINNAIEKNNEVEILVNGTKETIKNTNKMINTWLDKNKTNIYGKNISIIDLYQMNEIKNINEILNKHEFIINTSGEHKIEDVFTQYYKENKLNIVNQ